MANFTELIKQSDLVLVDFYADWCGPCKTMSPILTEVKKHFNDKLKVLKINVDNNQGLSAKLQIRGVPTLMLYKSSQQVWRQSGVVDVNQLISLVNSHL
ncbi:MAG: thioredoxin [Flavobacteriaceae bacterium]|nr:thioredoxin [Flavobacteriaceae bacterium]